jgi:hypothetical protein
MDFETIFDWTAKRAGGRITVYGKTKAGDVRRLVGVDRIQPGGTAEGNRVFAIDKDGCKYVLALTSQG